MTEAPPVSTLEPRLASELGALRERLRARHGWTHVEVTAEVDSVARRIGLRGEVAVDRLVASVVETAQRVAPGWSVDAGELRVMAGGSWYELAGDAVLLAACPHVDGSRRVATERRQADGPVQRLGEAHGALVVRGRDGTVGWLEGALGPAVEPPRLSPPHGDDAHALVAAARRWVGAPYRLGGTTPQGVDCSALVQRLVLDRLGVLLPRHSSDQLMVAPREGPGTGVGDLVFIWSAREAFAGLCHVGIGSGATVVHTSLSRRRVVEDPMEAFLADARRVMHVPLPELLAFGRRVAGWPSLSAAGIRLGRDPEPPT